jgi:5-methylcytosine-specific restriction protein A
MPTLPLRACSTHGCSEKVHTGKCTAHAKAECRAKDQFRGSARERGYTPKWDEASRNFRKEFPLCGMRPNDKPPVMSRCFDEGRLTPATQVDHVISHRGDRDLFWDRENNWQSLCAQCHSRKTVVDDGGFGNPIVALKKH